MKSRWFYVGMNLIAPGLAQCSLGFWVNGLIQLFASLALCAWTIWAALYPLVMNIRYLLSGGTKGALAEVNAGYFTSIAIPLGLLTLLWVWSIVEIILKIRDESQNPETKNEKEIAP